MRNSRGCSVNRRASDRALREERALDRAGVKRKGPRKSLRHLPAGKRTEIAWVKDLIFAEFAEAISGRRADGVRDGKILKLILHGPYASGAWFDDPAGAYFADYEFLVVVSSEKLADVGEFWSECEKKLLFATADRVHLRTYVRLTVYSLEAVNDQIDQGSSYFRDIVDSGVVLHDTADHPFSEYVSGRSIDAELHLEEGMALLDEYLGSAKLSFANGWYRKAAFDLHQATERLYNTVLLVLAGYTPHTHNLVQLRRLAEPLDHRLSLVWPSEDKEHRRCFELLRGAYIRSRYNRHYRVTEGELRWLLGQVEHLADIVEVLCSEWIEARLFEGGVGNCADFRRASTSRDLARPKGTVHPSGPGQQIIDAYFAARAAQSERIADQRLLPATKPEIKEAILAALREATDLETIRRLTEGFVGLADWLLVNELELSVLETNAATVADAEHMAEYKRLANRVTANKIALGAELEKAIRRTSHSLDRL